MKWSWRVKQIGATALMVASIMTSTCVTALAGELTVEPYVGVSAMKWQEFSNDGSRSLKETGPIWQFGANGKYRFDNNVTLRSTAEFYTGRLNYDGENQAGTPSDTKTSYLGVKLEGAFGYAWNASPELTIEPYVGVGYNTWKRRIGDSSVAEGYPEYWQTLYAKAAASFTNKINQDWAIFGDAGVKFPFWNAQRIDLTRFDMGDITTRPGKRPSAIFELGAEYKRFTLTASYEGMRFAKSPDVDILNGTSIVYQPKSQSDMYGIKLGYRF
ncbi:MAG TPA: outer membrane beta-barrel protein [Dissulfurispiraceae bacterium]|nr:outer membrane beta-barrel protein [Dissulfurispiraceae bacterium]